MSTRSTKSFQDATLFTVFLKKTTFSSTSIGDAPPTVELYDERTVILNLALPHIKQTPTSKPEPASASVATRRIDEWIKNNTTDNVQYDLASLQSAGCGDTITVIHA